MYRKKPHTDQCLSFDSHQLLHKKLESPDPYRTGMMPSVVLKLRTKKEEKDATQTMQKNNYPNKAKSLQFEDKKAEKG